MENFLGSLMTFVADNPASFLILTGVVIVVLALVRRFNIPEIGEVGIQPKKPALSIRDRPSASSRRRSFVICPTTADHLSGANARRSERR